MRWRYGDTNPVMAAVDSAVEIEIGDLVFLNTNDVRPASYQADQGTEADNQALFAENFLGVAMQQSRVSDTNPVRIATTGVFEFDCESNTFELGDLIGACEHQSGAGLLDQTTKSVATADLAIARVARRETSASSSVLIDIRSTVMTGGVNGTTASGT
jgi:hypothetical protein